MFTVWILFRSHNGFKNLGPNHIPRRLAHVCVCDFYILMCIQVVVLGDIGRSPRMQYHSIALAYIAGYDVEVFGYSGYMCMCSCFAINNI